VLSERTSTFERMPYCRPPKTAPVANGHSTSGRSPAARSPSQQASPSLRATTFAVCASRASHRPPPVLAPSQSQGSMHYIDYVSQSTRRLASLDATPSPSRPSPSRSSGARGRGAQSEFQAAKAGMAAAEAELQAAVAAKGDSALASFPSGRIPPGRPPPEQPAPVPISDFLRDASRHNSSSLVAAASPPPSPPLPASPARSDSIAEFLAAQAEMEAAEAELAEAEENCRRRKATAAAAAAPPDGLGEMSPRAQSALRADVQEIKARTQMKMETLGKRVSHLPYLRAALRAEMEENQQEVQRKASLAEAEGAAVDENLSPMERKKSHRGGVDMADMAELAQARARFRGAARLRLIRRILASETAGFARNKEWGQLRRHVNKHTKMGIVHFGSESVHESRLRHSVVSLAQPLQEWEVDPAHLRDHQAAQLFWAAVTWELVWLAFWNRTDEASESGAILILPVIIKGLTAAATCIAVLIIGRMIFRIGNRCRASRVRPKLGRTLFGFAWSLHFFFMGGCLWVVVAYASCYNKAETQILLVGWLTGVLVSWFLMEPAQIMLIVALPCIFKTKTMEKMLEYMQNAGIDLSMLM